MTWTISEHSSHHQQQQQQLYLFFCHIRAETLSIFCYRNGRMEDFDFASIGPHISPTTIASLQTSEVTCMRARVIIVFLASEP